MVRAEVSGEADYTASSSPEQVQRTLHELQVHQIELEMQNEELRRAQLDLEESRSAYVDLYDFAPVGYLTLNQHGAILRANLTAASLLGVARSALVRERFSRFIVPEDEDIFYLHHRELFATLEPRSCELRLARSGAPPFWALIEATAAAGVDGQPVCRATLTDISGRKRDEQVLRIESRVAEARFSLIRYALDHSLEELLRQTLDQVCELTSSPLGFYQFELEEQPANAPRALSEAIVREHAGADELPSGGGIDTAAVWEDCTRQRQAFIRNDCWSLRVQRGLADGPAPIREIVAPVLRGGRIVAVFGAANKRADYDQRDLETLARFADLAWDIAGHKRADEEREHLRDQLTQAQKMESIGRLAGGIAHDFNNMLTVINGYSNMALKQIAPGHRQAFHFTEILRAGERAADLVRQLLAYSRKQVLQPEVLNLNATVAKMELMLRRLLGDDIDFVVRLDPCAPTVLADRNQIEQVIMNLAVNARDAMPAGGTLTIETGLRSLERVSRTCREPIKPGTYAELTVRDTGVGMDAATLERIFEPFFTTKEMGKGTGLGLSTAQGIAVQSGGHIEVESEPGKGAAFYVRLPLAGMPAIEASRSEAAKATGGAETILLVEDEDCVRRYLAETLRHYGYQVVEAADARRAICLGSTTPFDLLVTDVSMPKMSGMEVAKCLRLIQSVPRALFVSGYSGDLHEGAGEFPSGAQYLQKPFSPETLAKKVREVLASR
jgi:PAS domain S-box-containing protein